MLLPKWLSKRLRRERPESGDPLDVYRRMGVKIGKGCVMYKPEFDTLCPFLIEIGDNVGMSAHVLVIAHDGAPYMVAGKERFAKVRIEDQVFIGSRAIILPGVTIGRQSVVAAGAVVVRDVPPREVWGGNPARFICTLDDYLARLGQAGGTVIDVPVVGRDDPGYKQGRVAYGKMLRDLAEAGRLG